MTAADDSLLGPAQIRQLADLLDLRPTKTLGQNFVHDGNTVRRIVAAADITAHDHVLEIGPGLGSLTLGLIGAAASVTAVEIDERLATRLPETVAIHSRRHADRLTVLATDALRIRAYDLLTPPTALVANLPYNVGVPVLLHALAEWPSIRRVLVMVQAEVADRLAAPPGSRTYGGPSAKIAWYGAARRAGSVARSVFWPVPKVDSALVRVDGQQQPGDGELRRATFAAIDAAFAMRRKTLRAALAGWAGSASAAEAVCHAAGIDHRARGETLGIEQFIALAKAARRR